MADPRGCPSRLMWARALPTAPSTAPPWWSPGWHRARQGHRVGVRPARRHDRDPQPEGRAPGRGPRGHRGAGRHGAHRDLRHPRTGPDRGGLRRDRGGRRPTDVLINNAAANFPVPAEDMSPNAWRTVVDITLNGTFFCARELAAPAPGRRHARLDRERRRPCVDRRPGLRPQARRQGRRQEHGRDARRGVGPLRHPGERAGAGSLPARGHDRRHPGQPRPHERQGPHTQPAFRVGRPRGSAGRPPSSRRRTAGSSAATRSWSTAPTGSAAASRTCSRDRARPDGQGPLLVVAPVCAVAAGNTSSGMRTKETTMPRRAWSKKRERQYRHIKSGQEAGRERGHGGRSPLAPSTRNGLAPGRPSSGAARRRRTSRRVAAAGCAPQGPEGPDEGAALQRGQEEGDRGPVEDEQGSSSGPSAASPDQRLS